MLTHMHRYTQIKNPYYIPGLMQLTDKGTDSQAQVSGFSALTLRMFSSKEIFLF